MQGSNIILGVSNLTLFLPRKIALTLKNFLDHLFWHDQATLFLSSLVGGLSFETTS